MVTVNEWTDRIYQHTPQEHIITNVVSGRKMKLQKYNFPDTGKITSNPDLKYESFYSNERKISFSFSVIWNPWVDQAREIGDLGDDEYPNMLCVEAGHVSTPVILLPGTAFEASQILQVNNDSFCLGVFPSPFEAIQLHPNAQWLHSFGFLCFITREFIISFLFCT